MDVNDYLQRPLRLSFYYEPNDNTHFFVHFEDEHPVVIVLGSQGDTTARRLPLHAAGNDCTVHFDLHEGEIRSWQEPESPGQTAIIHQNELDTIHIHRNDAGGAVIAYQHDARAGFAVELSFAQLNSIAKPTGAFPGKVLALSRDPGSTLFTFGVCLARNYWTCDPEVEKTRELFQLALDQIPDTDPRYPEALDVAQSVFFNHQRLNDEAGGRGHEMKQPPSESSLSPSELAKSWQQAALEYLVRAKKSQSRGDIAEAIRLARQVLDLPSESDDDYTSRLGGLVTILCLKYENFKPIPDAELDDMINFTTKLVIDSKVAIAPRPRSDYLHSLADMLCRRFERRGHREDINNAIRCGKEELALNQSLNQLLGCAEKVPNSLVWAYFHRYQRFGASDDLQEANTLAHKALKNPPDEQESRLHLCRALINLYSETKLPFEESLANTNTIAAIVARDQELLDEGHMMKGEYYNTQGLIDMLRSKQNPQEAKSHLTNAIEWLQKAKGLEGKTCGCRHTWLNSLGNAFLKRYRFRSPGCHEDRDAAIEAFHQALDEMPPDHGTRGLVYLNLSTALRLKDYEQRSDETLREWAEALENAWLSTNSPSTIRILGAGIAASLFEGLNEWEKAAQLAADAILLLPRSTFTALSFNESQELLKRADVNGLAQRALASGLRAGKPLAQLLPLFELGRNIINSMILDLRNPLHLSELVEAHPLLADEFVALRDQLDGPSVDAACAVEPKAPVVKHHEQRQRIAEAFEVLLRRIRAQAGFRHFLRPPGVSDLMKAAAYGPIIIINASWARNDAVLVQENNIDHVELTLPWKKTEAQDNGRIPELQDDQTSVLEWLWDQVCSPCLKALKYNDPVTGPDQQWRRVWWIVSGALSLCPMHAAGRYYANSTESVMDRVISSYAMSLQSLLHARAVKTETVQDSDSDRKAVLISMPETPEYPPLDNTEKEVHALEKVCHKLLAKPFRPKCTKEEVLKALQDCSFFHFAGHGESNTKAPMQSCILLKDWQTSPLTVSDIRHCRLRQPFLAYLSACEVGQAQYEYGADENIHLTSAFQLAGFRHVIGTLHPVNDKACEDIAKIVYDTIIQHFTTKHTMTDDSVALGLHLALRQLRNRTSSPVLIPPSAAPVDEVRAKLAFTTLKPSNEQAEVDITWYAGLWTQFVHWGP